MRLAKEVLMADETGVIRLDLVYYKMDFRVDKTSLLDLEST